MSLEIITTNVKGILGLGGKPGVFRKHVQKEYGNVLK